MTVVNAARAHASDGGQRPRRRHGARRACWPESRPVASSAHALESQRTPEACISASGRDEDGGDGRGPDGECVHCRSGGAGLEREAEDERRKRGGGGAQASEERCRAGEVPRRGTSMTQFPLYVKHCWLKRVSMLNLVYSLISH